MLGGATACLRNQRHGLRQLLPLEVCKSYRALRLWRTVRRGMRGRLPGGSGGQAFGVCGGDQACLRHERQGAAQPLRTPGGQAVGSEGGEGWQGRWPEGPACLPACVLQRGMRV